MGELRKIWQIRALPDLKPQEEELLEKAEAGEALVLGDGELPSEGNDTRSIRAGIIRYLMLGGCDGLRCHEKGVQISGAWVSDRLDLDNCDSVRALDLKNCRFTKVVALMGANLRAICLDGSHCIGIEADGLQLQADLNLRQGFQTKGKVRLPGAEIGGNLDCDAATFDETGGVALFADGLKVGGDIFLSDKFNSSGEVSFFGAEIGGNFECIDSTFRNMQGVALNASHTKVVGDFIWTEGTESVGSVNLERATCGRLVDDWSDWPKVKNSLELDGFTYKAIRGDCAVDAETRLKWLALDDLRAGFRPQPYQHLAKVLREMGHAEDARRVMVAKERLQRADARRRQRSLIAGAQEAQNVSLELADPRPELSEDFDRERWLYKKQNTVEDDLLRLAARHTYARPGGDSDRRKAREGLDPASRALAARGRRNDMRWEIAKARFRIGVSFVVQYVFDALIGFGYRPMRAVWTIAVMLFFGWWLFAQTWGVS